VRLYLQTNYMDFVKRTTSTIEDFDQVKYLSDFINLKFKQI